MYGQCKSFCGQKKKKKKTNERTDGQTDRQKIYVPDLSMRRHKKEGQACQFLSCF